MTLLPSFVPRIVSISWFNGCGVEKTLCIYALITLKKPHGSPEERLCSGALYDLYSRTPCFYFRFCF